MKRYLLLLIFLVVGCTSTMKENIEAITHRYENVTYGDGVSLEEAKVIAQRELIKQNIADVYDLLNPKIVKNITDLPHYEDYWFVSFEEKNPANITFIFMAIFHKQTGQIKFADDLQEDRRWILEAAMLK